ncbi:MAG: NADPH-dependent reductase [Solirubrobacterales bacterium]|nr:NADPH-dependent reductase [Solirubrobacterales bacterium]
MTVSKPVLMIVLASVRPVRAGEPIARWFERCAHDDGTFEVDFVDLKALDLPPMQEPNHPRLQQYTLPHTKSWSARVDRADAVAFVMPEYNYGYTAPLKNAFDYLTMEWLYKPVGFISYGGVAAGTRAVQQFKQVVTALKMTPTAEAVALPFVQQLIADGRFVPSELVEAAALDMLGELRRLEVALRPLRDGVRGAGPQP